MTNTDTYSEAHRHACECRYVARLPTNREKHEYIKGVRKKRGNVAAERLYEDTKALLK